MKGNDIRPLMAAGVRYAITTLRRKRREIQKIVKSNNEGALREFLSESMDKDDLLKMDRRQVALAAVAFMRELDNLCNAAQFREAAILEAPIPKNDDTTS